MERDDVRDALTTGRFRDDVDARRRSEGGRRDRNSDVHLQREHAIVGAQEYRLR
jgi:hypothetical protein